MAGNITQEVIAEFDAIRDVIINLRERNLTGGYVGPCFDEEALLFGLKSDPVVGRKAIEDKTVKFRAIRKVKDITFELKECHLLSDDAAHCYSNNNIMFEDGGESKTRALIILKKRENQWFIFREMVTPM